MRADEPSTAEDRAALLLAGAFGYGTAWPAAAPNTRAAPDEPDDDDDGEPDAEEPDYSLHPERLSFEGDGAEEPDLHALLTVAKESEVIELAHRCIDPRHPPAWLATLPADQQAGLIAWSNAHPIAACGPRRPREHAHWKRYRLAVRLKTPPREPALLALSRANLDGPLEPLLRLYALQDAAQIDTVLRYAEACGHDRDIASDALARVLCPALLTRGQLRRTVAMRRADYLHRVHHAERMLADWLHRACVRFLAAYGGHAHQRHGNAIQPAKAVMGEGIRRRTVRSVPRAARVIAA